MSSLPPDTRDGPQAPGPGNEPPEEAEALEMGEASEEELEALAPIITEEAPIMAGSQGGDFNLGETGAFSLSGTVGGVMVFGGGNEDTRVGLNIRGGASVGTLRNQAKEDRTGAWDLGDIQELVVNEKKGSFESQGAARDDVFVIEEESFDPDDEIIVAVWDPEPGGDGEVSVRPRRVRKQQPVPPHLVPYGVIGVGLGGLLLLSLAAIIVIIGLSLVAGPSRTTAPLDRSKLPKVERPKVERKQLTAEEILEEVLRDEAAKAKAEADDAE